MIFNSKKNAVYKLAEDYSTDTFPIDKAVLKSTVQVGEIRYRCCAGICLDKEGFYLRIKFMFKSYPDIFIPWKFIKKIKYSKLLFESDQIYLLKSKLTVNKNLLTTF